MAGLVDIGSAIAGPLTKIVGDVLNRVLPAEKMSEKDRADVESRVLLELQKQDFSALAGQLQINLEEAKSSRLFVSGWRPYIGWVCGNAMAYTFIVQPAAAFTIQVVAWSRAPGIVPFPPLPTLDMGSLMSIVLGLLGLGGMRTYEKVRGVK